MFEAFYKTFYRKYQLVFFINRKRSLRLMDFCYYVVNFFLSASYKKISFLSSEHKKGSCLQRAYRTIVVPYMDVSFESTLTSL